VDSKVNSRNIEQEIANELGFGIVPNLFQAAETNPDVQRALWDAFKNIVLCGRLPRTIKEMMGVVISKQAGSTYAAQVHLHALTLRGVEEPVLRALEQGEAPSGVPEKTQALLRFAYAASRAPHDPAQTEYLDGVGLSAEERLEAVAVVGLFRMVNSWTDLLAIPLDEL